MGFPKAGAGPLLVFAGLFGALSASPAAAATITVGNLLDTDVDGDGCTLREAIQNANGDDSSGSTDCVAGSGVDRIEFASSGTITVGALLPNITDPDALTIDGAGRTVTVSGGNAVPILDIDPGASLHLRDLTIANASDSISGGLENGGTTTAVRVRFTGNIANFGAGVYNTGTFTAIDSTFSGNTGFIEGGAIINTGLGTTQLTGCTFAGNEGATKGGGVYNQAGSLTVTNCTFSGNSASAGGGTGGGIFNSLVNATASIVASTFSGNSATTGGGIANGAGSVTLTDSIVANSASGGNCSGTITDGGGNVTWPAATCPGTSADPMLGPLQANGVWTQTMEPLSGSAAVDVVPLAGCVAVDQRGVTRPIGSLCDAGAVERLPTPNLIFWGDFEIDGYAAWSFAAP